MTSQGFTATAYERHTSGVCGRFALDQETDSLVAHYLATTNKFPEWAPRWNIAPTSTMPLIVDTVQSNGSIGRVLGPARWSLTPPWSATLEPKYPTFNARSESAAEKPTFRGALSHHRGLIPATAYYEWKEVDGKKAPYAVKDNSSLLSLAALSSVWDGDSHTVVTATILTRQAPESLRWLHERSPMPLPKAHWDEWLSPLVTGDQDLLRLATDWSTEVLDPLTVYPVRPLTGDHSELLSPVV